MRFFSSLLLTFSFLASTVWADFLEQSRGCWVSTSIQHNNHHGHYSAVLDLRDGFKIGTLFLMGESSTTHPQISFPAESTRDIRVVELIEKTDYAIARCEVDEGNSFVLHLTKESISLYDEFGHLQAVFLKRNISSTDFVDEFQQRIEATVEMKPHFRDSWSSDFVFHPLP